MIFIMVLVVLGVLGIIAYPVVRGRVRKDIILDDTADRMGELIKRKESSYAAIKELDFDYQTGKLSDEDYKNLYTIYKSEALKTIQALEEGELSESALLDAQIEEEIKKSRGKPGHYPEKADGSSGGTCPACGVENQSGNKFCTACGVNFGAKCGTCGIFNLPEAQFCSNCGERLIKYCLQCGYSVQAGETFCSQCGTALRVTEKNDI